MAKEKVATNDDGGKGGKDDSIHEFSALLEIEALACVLGTAIESAFNINAERPDAGNNDDVSSILYGCEKIVELIRHTLKKAGV